MSVHLDYGVYVRIIDLCWRTIAQQDVIHVVRDKLTNVPLSIAVATSRLTRIAREPLLLVTAVLENHDQ